MASGIRIERCPDRQTAEQRAAALSATGFQVQTISGPAIVVRSDVTVSNGSATLDDAELWGNAAFVVIGVLP